MIKETLKGLLPGWMLDSHRARRDARRYRYFASLDPSEYPDALRSWFYRSTGKALDLDDPQSFDEKIQWLKLYNATHQIGRLSDKYLVREWVAQRVGKQYLVPLLGVWDSPDDIDLGQLPERFVLKATHGCGWNIVVADKDALDWAAAKASLRSWLDTDYSFVGALEMQYQHCKPRIVAEQYLQNEAGDLHDYKFFCFDGEPACIALIRGRASSPEEACFDADWNRLPCTYCAHPRIEGELARPERLDEAIAVACKLAEGFAHVRVDLYLPDDGQIYFGEMTFTTLSGNSRWDPPEYNDYFGSKINLTQLPRWKEMHGA